MRRREKEIVTVLANCVRAMTIQQLSRTWWTDTPWGLARAKAVVEEMARSGWLGIRVVLSRPVCSLESPLVSWVPPDEIPDFGALSKTLHQRAFFSAQAVTAVFATNKSVALFGKGALPPVKLTQMTHDLQVSEIYLAYRSHSAHQDWVGEDQFPRSWPVRQRPDAVLRDSHGVIYRAIEYGGDYSPERLAALHEGLAHFGSGLSYEIW